RFHRELASGTLTGPVKLEVSDLQTSMGELEEKIKLMENFGEKLAMSMESAAVGKWQSIEGEETVHTQLVELVDQMRTMLLHATQSEEDSQKTMALSNFETLYSQAMKLQVQMNNLRLSHLERNREIMGIKRQLLLQEVNNLLLQADISRRETELCQFQEAKTFSSLKRWKTFGGSDRHRPQAMMELPSSSMVRSATEREPKPYSTDSSRLNIPYIAEELTPVTSSSISAPASPSALAGDAPSVQLHSTPRSRHEQATDHTETHLQTPPTSGPCRQLSPKAPRFLPPKRSEDTTKLPQSAKASPHSVRPAEGSKPSTETLSSTQLKPTSARSLSDSSKDVARAKTISVDERRAQFQIRKPEFQTICDSAPLHEEIQQLRKAKSEVEQGSPTLTQRPGAASAPSPEAGPGPGQPPESPTQVIPVQQSLAALRAQSSVTFPAVSVMECTDIPPRVETITDSDQGSSGGSSLHTRSALTRTSELPPISDHSKIGSKVARSPLSKHKLLRRQREERETKLREYQAISPKGSPVATRGKPPLPKQSMPIKQSPTSSPAPEKGPRSKSVGDMDRGVLDSTPSKPLQDAINRFEKRATVCETEDRPIELRKTPSPTLHLPRVGLVSRVRRLKPAAELLEESQRYRSGHSIYATRIMQKYLPKPDPAKPSPNKENVSYVHAMVSRLSRDNTPVRSAGSSRTNSDLSLQRTDSPRTHSEFVTQIVRKLSTPSGSDGQKNMAPFKDLTNEGIVKKLAETFSHPAKSSPERAFSDSGIDRQRGSPSALKTQHRKSCEVAMVLSTSPASDISYQMISSMSSDEGGSLKPESQPGPSSHQSLPILPSTDRTSESRSRAATYCVSDKEKKKQEEAEGSEIEVLPPSSPKSDSSSGKKHKERSRKTSSEKKEEKSRLQSSLSPERRGAGRGKMGTVGVLCKQSISFDLGVSLYGQASKAAESPGKSRQARSWDPSESSQAAARAEVPSASGGYTRTSSPPELGAEARPQSTSSEGEAPPSSPTADEKKKRRFLDSAWLQKSKKFFKVSK
ncbi:serine/arginine repetitive matrix protein 5-like, partial [Physella acuta]|uniref:serine/arginine repetitive matrix protein 5-like n=1 Tax=Physella acuta TaxID=109671 RepID=UPI0027DDA28E